MSPAKHASSNFQLASSKRINFAKWYGAPPIRIGDNVLVKGRPHLQGEVVEIQRLLVIVLIGERRLPYAPGDLAHVPGSIRF